jgi:hypothetical protein
MPNQQVQATLNSAPDLVRTSKRRMTMTAKIVSGVAIVK